MPAKTLTQAWTTAEAKKPRDWILRGVVLGPREVDPTVRSATWVAFARGPDGERESGEGDTPEEALIHLGEKLAKRRGSTDR